MKKILSILIVIILLFSIGGCSKKEETYKKQMVKIAGLKGPTSIGMIKMFEEKPSLGEKLESEYEAAQSPDILISKLLSKEVDFAALPTNVAAKLYNKKVGYELVAVNTWGVLYIMTQDEEIKDWKDLKGKSINSIAKGSTPDVVFRYLLKKNGLNPETDVTLDYTLGHVELAQSMVAGKVNIALLPEPFVTMVKMKNKEASIAMNLQDEWKNTLGGENAFPQGCLVVRQEFAQKQPEAVERFLEEYKKSINWVNENKEEAGVLVEKYGIGMKAKMAEMAIPRCNIAFKDAQNAKGAVDEYFKIIYDFSPKDIGGKLPDENFYHHKK